MKKVCKEKEIERYRRNTDRLSEFLNKYSDKFESEFDFGNVALCTAKYFARMGICFDFYNNYNFLNNVWFLDENIDEIADEAIKTLDDNTYDEFYEDFTKLAHSYGFKHIWNTNIINVCCPNCTHACTDGSFGCCMTTREYERWNGLCAFQFEQHL